MTLASMLHDVDPDVVARGNAERARYAAKVASWGWPMRCTTGTVDQDGSCLRCGDGQGERARCPR